MCGATEEARKREPARVEGRRTVRRIKLTLIRMNGDPPDVDAIAQEITRYLDERCVAVFGPSRPRTVRGFVPGSGLCVRIADRFLVATAAHVVLPLADDEIHFQAGREAQFASVPIAGVHTRGGGDAEAIDLAWLEIEPAVAGRLPRAFVPLNQLEPGFRETHQDRIFAHGCPGRLIDPSLIEREGRLNIVPYGLLTRGLGPGEHPRPPAVDTEIFFVYTGEDSRRPSSGTVEQAGRDPTGMSGGSIWAAHCERDVWSLDQARMIGIIASWYPDNRCMRGTRIEHWLRFVADDFSELAPLIDMHLNSQQTR